MIYRERGSKNHNAMEDFQAFLVITLLTWAAVSVFGTTPDISTTTGDTVNIPCVFEEGTLRNIYWYYDDGTGPQKILFLSKGEIGLGAEYANRASLQNDNSTLILKDITVADEGNYRCDVDRQGQTPVPNINTKLNVFSLRPDTLPVVNRCIGESASCIMHANQSSTLTCILPSVYPVEDTELIWYQDGKRVSSTDEVTQNDDGTADISRHIQVSETGNFTCNATYLSANRRENTAVSVQVLITPPAGKGMTSGQIAGITIGILLLVCILLAIITLTIYYLKKRGEGDSSTPQNKSGDPEQDQDVTTQLMQSPNTTKSPSTATATPAPPTTTTIATTTETTHVTGATTSTSFPPNEGQQRETTNGPSAANGANRSDKREVTNDEITSLAKRLPVGKYNELCEKLGFGYDDLQKILTKNFMDHQAAFKETLQAWKLKSGFMEVLDAALIEAELGGLVSKYKN